MSLENTILKKKGIGVEAEFFKLKTAILSI